LPSIVRSPKVTLQVAPSMSFSQAVNASFGGSGRGGLAAASLPDRVSVAVPVLPALLVAPLQAATDPIIENSAIHREQARSIVVSFLPVRPSRPAAAPGR
jgi:hypothetical protein